MTVDLLKRFWRHLALFFGSLWAGAVVITFLPEGTVALHTAALLSIAGGVGAAVVWFKSDVDELERVRRAVRR